jgi:OmpA-OmpF porin, OOP family
LSNHFATSASLLYTGISGDDEQFPPSDLRYTRGFSFKSPLTELSIRGEIYPFGIYKPKKRQKAKLSNTRRSITPYISLGLGAAFFKPKNDWNGPDSNSGVSPDLIQQDIDAAKNNSFCLPLELGTRFRITDQFTLGIAGTFRYTPSDFLDGVSAAGKPADKDQFYTVQAQGSYAFGKPQKPKGGKHKKDKEPAIDTDSDGVSDDNDDCIYTPGSNDRKGCPDEDRDGVYDHVDKCPTVYGLKTLNGCPDEDEDGVADYEDNCLGIKGVAAYRGCPPVDRDKDGVADAEDLCPDMSGQLRWKGCPDSDNDGFPDNKDGCPGIAGPALFKGCPDSDGDGISDKEDECPTIAGILIKKGCPEALPPSPGVSYKALYFDSRLEDWQVTSLLTLEEVVHILNADATLFARIEGHTDNTGREPANDLLAEKRAQKCRDNLVSRGVGSKKPIVANDTPANRQLNRRVEIHFYRKN